MNTSPLTNDHEQGYRAALAGSMSKQWDDHWSGEAPIAHNDDWFTGYQDALDDTAMGNPSMYEVGTKAEG